MTEEEQYKIDRIKELSKELGLIDSKTFREKYFGGSDKRQNAKYHFNKYNKITISGSVFIIDPKIAPK